MSYLKHIPMLFLSFFVSFALGIEVYAQEALPLPSGNPMEIDFDSDPVLLLRHRQADPAEFKALLLEAIARHPMRTEALALRDEAEALLDEAREARLPTVDATISSYRVIAREFSNDPDNLLERSRPSQRTDATLEVQQTLVDFGAGASRIRAGSARLRAAASDVEVAADNVVLNAIASWYDVFAYRALVGLTEAFLASQRDLRGSVEERIREGVSAEGDLARIDSYLAQTQTRLARYRRVLSNADARFAELAGAPPPPGLARAPSLPTLTGDREEAMAAALTAPGVRSAEARSDAARQDARAARAGSLPQLGVAVDAGRYGVFETDRDYDIRGRLTLRHRLFGGIDSRIAQSEARARATEARSDRIRDEAARDAAIAWSDVQALEQQLEALEAAYIASRRSRDVILERFRVARGTLFDVVAAEEVYFESATAYVQTLTELDAARYVLLSRSGRLLERLGVPPDQFRVRG